MTAENSGKVVPALGRTNFAIASAGLSMSPSPVTQHRRQFLLTLFRGLEVRNTGYCVLRNYLNIYETDDADVDILVEPTQVEGFRASLESACLETGQQLVLQGWYVSTSHVVWHPEGTFTRIDLDTQVRWRVFPILSAAEVISRRRRFQDFYVPHPVHESAIIYAASTWRSRMSERYRARLFDLYRAVESLDHLRETLQNAFGKVGADLAVLQSRLGSEKADAALWPKIRRSLVQKSLSRPNHISRTIQNVGIDLARSWRRLSGPTGLSIHQVSSASPPRRPEAFLEGTELLYPAKKSRVQSFNHGGTPASRVSVAATRAFVLFKGGLLVRSFRVAEDQALSRWSKRHRALWQSARDMVCLESSSHDLWLAHPKTGFMAEYKSVGGSKAVSRASIPFLAGILRRQRITPNPAGFKRGLFAVLIGLDGSGKTTVARQLCCLGLQQHAFSRMAYYHWQPRVFQRPIFPLPEFREVPRKQPLRHNVLQQTLSVFRLVKNALLTRIAFLFRVGFLLRRGALVLVDRYYYNYYLDPDSVKYNAGKAWVDLARSWFPKPDVVIVLKGSSEVLLSRKQELSEPEMRRQISVLQELHFAARNTIDVDVTERPEVIARKILEQLQVIQRQLLDKDHG